MGEDELSVSAQTVRRWIHEDKLTAVKLPQGLRVDKIDFEEFIEERKKESISPERVQEMLDSDSADEEYFNKIMELDSIKGTRLEMMLNMTQVAVNLEGSKMCDDEEVSQILISEARERLKTYVNRYMGVDIINPIAQSILDSIDEKES